MSSPHATWSLPGALGCFRGACLAVFIGLVSAQAALSASPIQQLTSDRAVDIRPAWSPDGRRIAFQSGRNGNYQVYLMDADGSAEQRLSAEGMDDRHPAWSPDGKNIAVASGGDAQREVWIIEVETGARTQVSQRGVVASFPTWSPDGRQLSFYGFSAGQLDLWVIGRDGSGLRRLTNGLASEQQRQCTFACHGASWSPDGTRLAYSTPDPAEVWSLLAADGTDARKMSPNGDPSRSHFPIYLPDGQLLYVTEHVTPGRAWTDVWALDPGSPGTPREILREVQAQGPFAFSGDGQWLAFASPRSGNFEIYRVRLDEEGKASLQVKSGETEPSPALVARGGHPAELPAFQGAPADTPDRDSGASGPAGLQPYLLAGFGVLVVSWLGIELLIRSRRRARRR